MSQSVLHNHSLLRTPYESIHVVTRNTQKIVAKEMSDVVTEMKRLSKAAKERSKGANLINATKSITSIVRKLQGLKRKMQEGQRTASKYVHRCQARLDHLNNVCKSARLAEGRVEGTPAQDDQLAVLAKDEVVLRSMDAMLVGHLMRQGCLASAASLAKSSNIPDLVDSEIFQSARKVVQGFRNRDCCPALAWCGANRSRLRRSNCALEADLRVQEFVELIRGNNVGDALKYARTHLANFPESHSQIVSHAMGAIAFAPPSDTLPKRYKYLFDERKWPGLENLFWTVLFKINGLSQQSTLAIRLKAGLEALKTPHCGDQKNTTGSENGKAVCSSLMAAECPVCAKEMCNLAKDLPISHRTQSCIVCGISGKVMNERNPPMALPNGNVYSRKALESNMQMNDGKVRDPRTGESFPFSSAKNVYIL